jgi:hypothetical protein
MERALAIVGKALANACRGGVGMLIAVYGYKKHHRVEILF